VLDAGAVTAVRTGAAAVLAAETLGRGDAETVAVVGAGVNGEATARTFAAGGRVPLVWDVDETRARAVADRVGGRVATREEALGADLVATVTPGREVLFPSGSLRPGQHVSLMGADGPGKAEIAVEELGRVRVFCDDWEQASHGGEVAAAVEAGVLTREDVTEIGHVLERRHPGLSVRANFAGSQVLATQLEQGATADVFADLDIGDGAFHHLAGIVDRTHQRGGIIECNWQSFRQ
jgi:ornithine cyclodeaminase/alanine dehydrogenase-like protein (mu-crystallin family)